MDSTRITLICTDSATNTRRWSFERDGSSARLVQVPHFRMLLSALEGGLHQEEAQDVERVIIDRTADPTEFLDLLSTLPQGFRGDVLYLQPSGKVFLSATGRSDERVLYSLSEHDVDFYVQVYGLESLDEWEDVPMQFDEIEVGLIAEPDEMQLAGGVLIAEDDRRTREQIVAMLREVGVEPLVAKSGFEAVRLADEYRPAVVLLDGLMPEMHGFEVARFLRRLSPDYTPRIVLLTAVYKSFRYQNDAKLKFGVDRYLLKPVSRQALAAALFDAPLEQPLSEQPLHALAS